MCEELTSRHRIIQDEKSTHAKPRFIRGGIPASVVKATAGWRICDVLDASGPPRLTTGVRQMQKPRAMQPQITFNDAWESIPLACVDDVIEFFNRELQPTHPLREYKLFPVAKCWRRDKYLVEEEEPSEILWVLDMHRKKDESGEASLLRADSAVETMRRGGRQRVRYVQLA